MLNERSIEKLPPGRHTDSRGLYLLVGKTVRTWQFKKRGRWIRIGLWPAWSCVAARQRALELAAQDDAGRPMGLTVKGAYDLWLSKKVPRSPLTLKNNASTLRVHFKDWENRDLTKLSRSDLVHRHAQIVRKSGPMGARTAMINFRSWWRQAQKLDPALPECPVVAVQLHPQQKVDESDLYNRLSEWAAALTVIRSPERRDFYMMALLTGMRRESLRVAKWTDIQGDVLHVPNPKRASGKAPRPYSVPLTEAHTTVLARLRALGTGSPFIFGGITEVRPTSHEMVAWRARGAPEFTPHSLRRCFITAGVEAGVHPYALSLLVNHAVPGMASHYVASSLDLRGAMTATVAVLHGRLDGGKLALPAASRPPAMG